MQIIEVCKAVLVRRVVAAAACALLVTGCVSESQRFRVGEATRDQVRAALGAPTEARSSAQGEETWFYSWLPSGRQIYVARFAADGVLRAYEPSLTTETIGQLRPGTTDTAAARALLGPPWETSRFERLERDIWEYPVDLHGLPYRLVLQFDYGGVLRESMTISELPNDNVFLNLRRR